MMRSRSHLAIASAVLVLASVAGGVAVADDPISARAFELRFKPLADAAELIDPLLSADGAVTLRPRLGTLVVEDHLSVLERVKDLLLSYDLPPRNAEVTLTLLLGHREDADGPERSGSELSGDPWCDGGRGPRDPVDVLRTAR